jgi:ABC-type transport system substrate-binding protein
MRRLTRRAVLAAPLALAAPPLPAQQPPAARKVLRLAFNTGETSFDPARISDLYSRTVTPHIFESLYQYDHLARPVQVIPQLADGMPEVSEDFRVWTVHVKRGVYFSDDAAFKGQPRELTAHDIVYPFKRLVDPANKSPTANGVLEERIVGLAALRKKALDEKKPFDYDAPVAGLQVVDRYTVRFTLEEPRPRLITSSLTASSTLGAQAREVVEFYGDNIGAHPVGTGPFRLVRERWVRNSRIVLERNPQYREVLYDARPAPDDAEGQAMLARFKGRRLPIVDEVEISVIEETQPLWLAFANAEIDALVTNSGSLPPEFIGVAAPNGKVAPHLGKRGVRLTRTVRADTAMMVFNMEDPLVGGFAPEKVALRRAISLAYDIEREIRLIRRGQAIPAQSPVVPFTSGYDADFKSPASDFDVPRANALLDLYGYAARDAAGWRKGPDGQPLKIVATTEPEQVYRDYNNLLRRCLKEVGIQVEFRIQQWPANLKQVQAGKFQLWMLGSSATDPDGQTALQRMYGPQSGQQNLARFKWPEFDRLYERMSGLPDGAEREQLFLEAKRIAAVYLPYRNLVHRIANELQHPWVHGYRRPVFWNYWWHLADIDVDRKRPG